MKNTLLIKISAAAIAASVLLSPTLQSQASAAPKEKESTSWTQQAKEMPNRLLKDTLSALKNGKVTLREYKNILETYMQQGIEAAQKAYDTVTKPW